MKEKEILPEIHRALDNRDFRLAESLDNLARDFEEGRDSYEFIDASRAAKLLGAEKCLIVHGLPKNADVIRAQEFAEYLVREARRREAVYVEYEESDSENVSDAENHKCEYIVVRFPDRPEDNYTVRAFIESIRYMARKPRQPIAVEEDER